MNFVIRRDYTHNQPVTKAADVTPKKKDKPAAKGTAGKGKASKA